MGQRLPSGDPESIQGLQYVPDYLDDAEHDRLLAAADAQPWQSTVDHRVQIYGFHYDHRSREAYRIGELPEWAAPLTERLRHDGLIDAPNQLVVNEYRPGEGFFEHIDQAVFGDVVVSVSLGSSCVMRFTRDGASHEILLEPRSALVLSGEARWHWKHGIPARTTDTWNGRELARGRRVSLTFRAIP
jgi:alkylated DNA repair dioxygenase AlkB